MRGGTFLAGRSVDVVQTMETSAASSVPNPGPGGPPPVAVGDIRDGVIRLLDLTCGVSILVGTGTISVRDCLTMARGRVLVLDQAAGEDLQILANGVSLARGEVMIDDEVTSIRVTEIAPTIGGEA